MGLTGPGTAEEHRMALEMLSISPGDRVLDVACGPGNFTRDFARAAGDGLVVGIDASETMLEVAVRETEDDNVAYVRGDACDLPFRDGSFDAVCCFAALYLIEEPMRALGEIVRVLAPGGRVALLTSCNRGRCPRCDRQRCRARAERRAGLRARRVDRALGRRAWSRSSSASRGLAQFVSARASLASLASDAPALNHLFGSPFGYQ